MAPPVILIFGLGYVEREFGSMMAASGWSVRGTTRHPDNFAARRGVVWDIISVHNQKHVGPSARSRRVSAILSPLQQFLKMTRF